MLRQKVKKTSKENQCAICEKFMDSLEQLRTHQKLYHSSVLRNVDKESEKRRIEESEKTCAATAAADIDA